MDRSHLQLERGTSTNSRLAAIVLTALLALTSTLAAPAHATPARALRDTTHVAFGGKVVLALNVQATALARIVLNRTTVTPGSTLLISGTGFAPNELVQIRSHGVVLSKATANGQGTFFSAVVIVPFSAPIGRSAISAVGVTSSRIATGYVAVVSAPPARISLNRYTVTPGSPLVINGEGFGSNEVVQIRFRGLPLRTVSANGQGDFFAATITLPGNTSAGRAAISLVGLSSRWTATAYVTVVIVPARISVNRTTVTPGSTFLISGTGFAPNELVRIRSHGAVLGSAPANGQGNFFGAAILVPVTAAPGRSMISATGALSGRTAVGFVTVVSAPIVAPARIFLNRTTVTPGSRLLISGTGFRPLELVLIRSHGAVLGTAPANGQGNFFGATITVPATAPLGRSAISLVGASSGRTATTYVTVVSIKPVVTRISLSSRAMHRGSVEYVTGSGYVAFEMVLIRFNGSVVAAVPADRYGHFYHAGFRIPKHIAFGYYVISATGGRSARSASAVVRVVPTASRGISISPHTVGQHQNLTVAGHGFLAHEVVLLTVRSRLIEAPMTDGHGTFRIAFRLPGFVHTGKQVVQAVGGRSRRHSQAVFVVVAKSNGHSED